MRMTTLHIPGQPIGKARARVVRGPHGVRSFTPAATVARERHIAWSAKASGIRIQARPVQVSIVALFEPAASLSRGKRDALIGTPHTQKPDADNVAKLVMDALTGIAWDDDSRVVSLSIRKEWAAQAGLAITIEPVQERAVA